MRMTKIQNTDNTKCCEGRGTGILIHCWWECEMVKPHLKTVCQLLTKRNSLTIWSNNHIPQCLPKGLENSSPHRNLHECLQQLYHNCQYLEAIWCPSLAKWITKLWYIQTMDYSAIKRTELSGHEKTWKNLKSTLFFLKEPVWKSYILFNSN